MVYLQKYSIAHGNIIHLKPTQFVKNSKLQTTSIEVINTICETCLDQISKELTIIVVTLFMRDTARWQQ